MNSHLIVIISPSSTPTAALRKKHVLIEELINNMSDTKNSYGLSIQLGKIQSIRSNNGGASKQNTPRNLSPRFLEDYDNIDHNLLLDAFSDASPGNFYNQYADVFSANPSNHDVSVQYHNMSMLPDNANMNESINFVSMYEQASKTAVGANKRSTRNTPAIKQEVFQNETKTRGNTRGKKAAETTSTSIAASKSVKSKAKISSKMSLTDNDKASFVGPSYYQMNSNHSMDSFDSHISPSASMHSKTPQLIAKERRRERNRVLARKTRAKKKVELELLRDQLDSLQKENAALRDIVVTKLPDSLQRLLASDNEHITDYIEKKLNSSQRMLKKFDISSVVMSKIKNLQSSFVICSCTEPNTPIVYASPAFMQLTGYDCEVVMGKNLFFLAGAGTNNDDLSQIQLALADGIECRKILMHYRYDGTKFYSLMQMAPLISLDNSMTLAIGVFVEVNVPPGKEYIVEKFNSYHSFNTNSARQGSVTDSFDCVSGTTTSDHNSSSGSGNNHSGSSSDNQNQSDTSSCGDQDDQRSASGSASGSATKSRRW